MIEDIIATLTHPSAWIKGANARTAQGRTIGSQCTNAVCFCIGGAAIRAGALTPNDRALYPILQAIRELFPERGGHGIPVFNDHPETTHADVLRVLHRAREIELSAPADDQVAA